jgi:hypothetical protein
VTVVGNGAFLGRSRDLSQRSEPSVGVYPAASLMPITAVARSPKPCASRVKRWPGRQSRPQPLDDRDSARDRRALSAAGRWPRARLVELPAHGRCDATEGCCRATLSAMASEEIDESARANEVALLAGVRTVVSSLLFVKAVTPRPFVETLECPDAKVRALATA